jgi:hypothetical protein
MRVAGLRRVYRRGGNSGLRRRRDPSFRRDGDRSDPFRGNGHARRKTLPAVSPDAGCTWRVLQAHATILIVKRNGRAWRLVKKCATDRLVRPVPAASIAPLRLKRLVILQSGGIPINPVGQTDSGNRLRLHSSVRFSGSRQMAPNGPSQRFPLSRFIERAVVMRV